MSFGKKSSNNNTTPQPVITPQAQSPQQPIQRTANTAEAQDRASQNNDTASLLATSMTDEEKLKRQQGGAGTLSTY